ncbi:MAG: zinc-binding dehydrogenase [Hyphomicrobiales bacterium]
MPKIKAAVARQAGEPLSIEMINLREPLSGEVEVTLKASSICHSDISFVDGIWGDNYPAVYGHEAAGTVTSLGDGVHNIKMGDNVMVSLIRSCGTCACCSSGTPVACSTASRHETPITADDGSQIVQGMSCGAFAERVVVDQSQLAVLPVDMKMDAASVLACGVITGVGAVINTAELRAGDNVVVIGCGGVGLNAIQGARIAGAARIIAVDMVVDKEQDALEFGATDFVLASDGNPWEKVREITKGKMADAVLVTVGNVPVYESAPNYLNFTGKIIMVGMPSVGAMAHYEPVNFAAANQSMRGSKMGDVVLARDIPWMIDLYQQGRLKLDELVSRHWTLEQINEAIADTKSGTARRNVIIFDEA